VFFLRVTHLDKGDGAGFDDIGSWTVTSDRRTLVLFGSREPILRLAVSDANTLRKLVPDGRAIASSLNYDLKRTPSAPSLEPRLPMRGMYRYLADAACSPNVSLAGPGRSPRRRTTLRWKPRIRRRGVSRAKNC
jgi:hypothetical protein